MACDPCGASPEEGDCDGAFVRYFFNQETNNCESFIWGGCGGVVPFESLIDCQNLCEQNSNFLENQFEHNKIIKIVNILGQNQNKFSE